MVVSGRPPLRQVPFVVDSALAVTKDTRQLVLVGAKTFRLPHRYIASIASLPSVADPDAARHAMELAIYMPR